VEELLSVRFDRSALARDPLLEKHLRAAPALEVPPDLRDDVRTIASRGWEDRARSEYVGVMIVRRFHGLLVDLNAPMDLQELALVMMAQEQHHAGLCVEAARALGSPGEISFELGELQQARSGAPMEQDLLQMICGTYAVGEVVAMALIRHALKALPSSGFRDILAQIARDEVLHAGIGPRLLRSIRGGVPPRWLGWPGDAPICAFVERQRAAMRGRDVVEPDEAALFEDPAAAAQLMAVGIPPSGPLKAAYLSALEVEVPAGFRRAGLEL
jgi:hypothetical protein